MQVVYPPLTDRERMWFSIIIMTLFVVFWIVECSAENTQYLRG